MSTLEEETWDLDAAEARPAVRNRRAVVSVAFPSEDFKKVSQAAERAKMKISEFIREAAIAMAEPNRPPSTMVVFAGGGAGTTFYVEAHAGGVTRVMAPSEGSLAQVGVNQ
jgi:hypothetical protein